MNSDSRPQVAVFVPHGEIPDRRGFAPAIVAEQLARRMERYRPLMVCRRQPGAAAAAAADGLAVRRLSMSRAYVRVFQKLTRLDPWPLHARLARLLENDPSRRLHGHQLEFPLGDFLARVRRPMPIVIHAHVTTQRPQAISAAAYIAVSEYVRGRLIDKGFPAARVHLVRNGVDGQLFSPVEALARRQLRERLGIPGDAPGLLFFGRKQEVKGFDRFLHVASRLSERLSDLRVFAIGAEPADSRREASYAERETLRARLAGGGRYFDLPALSQPALVDYLRIADVALLPSRAEPQGMAMVEAMSCGCATISSRVGGIPESIEAGVTGDLIDLGEAVATSSERTLALLQDPVRRQALATNGRRFVGERFDWAKSARVLEAVYDEVLGTGTAAAKQPELTR